MSDSVESSLQKLNLKQGVLVGITLFSMLFGAGNLILAPFMGVQAGIASPLALLGFIISGVGFPVLCLASIAKAGSALKLIDRINPIYSRIFMVLIYLSIGPCLAIPRTASTSYSMIEPLLSSYLTNDSAALIARVAFSFLFFTLVFVLTLRPSKLTQVMGKVSGPALIFMIVAVVGATVVNPPSTAFTAPVEGVYSSNPVLGGFSLGYQTMDVLAGFAYGIVIAMNIRALGLNDSKAVAGQVIKSGVLAGSLIGLIYLGFTYLGMTMGAAGGASFENGAQVISAAAQHQFGFFGALVVAAIFFIACLNVSVALTCSIAEYFAENFPRFSYRVYATATVILGFALANVGLTAILAYSVPILLALYPPALCLTIMGLALKHADRFPLVWKATIAITTIQSVLLALRDAFLPKVPLPMDALPLAKEGLSWVLPTLVCFVIFQLISLGLKKNN